MLYTHVPIRSARQINFWFGLCVPAAAALVTPICSHIQIELGLQFRLIYSYNRYYLLGTYILVIAIAIAIKLLPQDVRAYTRAIRNNLLSCHPPVTDSIISLHFIPRTAGGAGVEQCQDESLNYHSHTEGDLVQASCL